MPRRLAVFDWDDLRFFLAVARTGTLRGGAESIQANHATVSRRLAVLETAVEARLFDRTKGGLRLTQLGEELLPHALRVEKEIAAASRVVAGRDARPAGPIYVSIPPFMALSSIVDDFVEFSRQFEDIDIHLQVSNAFADLERREADVSIRYAYEVTDDVVGRKLVRCSKAVYCAAGYAEKIKGNGGDGLTWVGWNEAEGETTAPWVIKGPFPNARLRHRINEAVPQVTLAAAGAGLTYLPCFIGDRYPGLVRAPYQKPVPDRSLWLLLHSDLRKTARIRIFVDFMAHRIKSRKDEFVAGAT
ncbi:MAG: LysR family transcriptional regulator [Proteobacteria bacterium]|nr:LysR family transcriptional regulator [Pseudomonadota bacterium]